jgi:diguanylate cyclase (GGDEF)-like protein
MVFLFDPASMTARRKDPLTAAHSIIESIIELTEQRELHSLEQSMLASLAELLDGMSGWIIDLDSGSGQMHHFIASGHPDSLPEPIRQAANAMQEEDAPRLLSLDTGLQFLLVPLAHDSSRRVLALARAAWREQEQRLVLGLIKVYWNFVHLLFDSERDTLTGLYNRRKFEAKLTEVLAARLHRRRLDDPRHGDYLAVMDLDRFKQINDTHGHLIGDEVLLIFANLLQQTLRDSDLIFRYGGEEFVVILQTTPIEVVRDVLERVRQKVESHVFPQVGKVTLSIGYAAFADHRLPPEIIEEADRALYFAKGNGRNQVCDYRLLVEEGKIDPVKPHDGGVELF